MDFLSGTRVLDLAVDLPGTLATRMLAELGAHVTRIDPHPERGARWLIRNRRKRVVIGQREELLQRLGLWPDVIVYDRLDPAVVGAATDGAAKLSVRVVGSVSADHAGTNIPDYGLAALGGLTGLSGNPGGEPITPRPYQASYLTALFAATISCAWLAGGRSIRHAVVIGQECVAACLDSAFPILFIDGEQVRRKIDLHDLVWPASTYQTADGWVGITTARLTETRALLGLLGLAHLIPANIEGYDALLPMVPNLEPHLRREIRTWSTISLAVAAQRRGVAVGPALTPKQLLSDSQAQTYGFISELDGTKTLCFPARSAHQSRRRAVAPLISTRLPLLGALDHAPEVAQSPIPRPLDGVRIVDFTWALAGPLATMILSDLGAEVVKIESREHVDSSRLVGPYLDTPGIDTSGYFAWFNRGKLSIELDFAKTANRQALLELIAKADVVVENFRPRVLDRHGFGYQGIKQLRSGLAMCSLSGFGRSGPKADWRSYGAGMAECQSGIAFATGGTEPVVPGRAYSDFPTGLYTALVLCAQLHHQNRHGLGSYTEVTQFEACASTVEESAGGLRRETRESHTIQGSDVGGWFAVGRDGTFPLLTLRELGAQMQKTGFLSITPGITGSAMQPAFNLPIQLDGSRLEPQRPSPRLGEHTEAVWRDWQSPARPRGSRD